MILSLCHGSIVFAMPTESVDHQSSTMHKTLRRCAWCTFVSPCIKSSGHMIYVSWHSLCQETVLTVMMWVWIFTDKQTSSCLFCYYEVHIVVYATALNQVQTPMQGIKQTKWEHESQYSAVSSTCPRTQSEREGERNGTKEKNKKWEERMRGKLANEEHCVTECEEKKLRGKREGKSKKCFMAIDWVGGEWREM